jgi:ATPase subunit of ABC transporter with duplicated ATPase domains
VSYLAVNGLGYAHPGGDLLFSGVSFKLRAGDHAALVGVNGVGKSTLLKIAAGELAALEGSVATGGRIGYMPQNVGLADETVRELLLTAAPNRVAAAGLALGEAEARLAGGDELAGVALGEAIADWSELGGYELEGHWDVACREIAGAGLDDIGDWPADMLSGGERKRLLLATLFASEADVLLLDEPDNFLDIPAKRALERAIATTRKTVLMVSHDREVLTGACASIVTLEGDGAWVHGSGYASYPAAREHRQQLLGDRVERWNAEERRLRERVRIFKERAKYSPDWAQRANAAESQHRHWVQTGPPPAPVMTQTIRPRLRGSDSARRVVALRGLSIEGLLDHCDEEIHFGERVGLVGPNGTGKTHFIRALAGARGDEDPTIVLGNRVSAGLFTQANTRQEFTDATTLDVVMGHTGSLQTAMGALARYGLEPTARQPCATLSGGQRARLEILCLELEGHNLLLLDEPTDNLDIDSCEALERALEGFEGTIIAVSHDRAFLRTLDRFLMFDSDRRLRPIADSEAAIARLAGQPTAPD